MRNEPWCSWWALAGAPDSVYAAGSTCEQDLLRASCWDVPPLSCPEEGVGPLGERLVQPLCWAGWNKGERAPGKQTSWQFQKVRFKSS